MLFEQGVKIISVITYFYLSSPTLRASENICSHFYYVKRPIVASLILHEYIGIKDSEYFYVAGMPKANDDLNYFRSYIERNVSSTGIRVQRASVHYLGRACGNERVKALELAESKSKEWQVYYPDWIIYLTRMGATPILGKPCRKAALDISRSLSIYLN